MTFNDYLSHHGIKGQKWGVENGPPYPLDPLRDYSKAEKKANAKIIAKEYKENPYGLYRSKTIQSINFDELSKDEIFFYVDNLVGKYGDIKINKHGSTLSSYMRSDISMLIEDALNKKNAPENSKIFYNNKNDISKFMSKEMLSDFKRWNKENDIDDYTKRLLNTKSDKEILNILGEQLDKSISKALKDTNKISGHDKEIELVIDGIKDYSDNAPLTIIYDKDANKVIDFYYT